MKKQRRGLDRYNVLQCAALILRYVFKHFLNNFGSLHLTKNNQCLLKGNYWTHKIHLGYIRDTGANGEVADEGNGSLW